MLTLTSDFGTADGYVGAMKGAILSHDPALRIFDVAHDIPPWDVRRGAYALRLSLPNFPEGTVHVVVVDPGVGTGRCAVAACVRGQVVVAPDNGLLSMLLTFDPEAVVLCVDFECLGLAEHSRTFHGRDLFAPAGARLASGAVEIPGQLSALNDPVRFSSDWERVGESLIGHHVCADRFGNMVTTIPWSEIDDSSAVRVRIGPVVIERLVGTFGDAAPGSLVAFAGSLGLLEVAVVQGNAARLLEPEPGVRVLVEPRS